MTDKIIFFDIDRTLYDPNTKSIPTSTINALKKLHEAPNVEIAIATGRAFYMLHIIEEIKEYVDIFILINGQIIIKDNETIFRNPLSDDDVERIVTIFEDNALKYGFLGEHSETLNIVDEKGKRAFELASMTVPEVNPDFYKTNRIYQMWAFCEQTDHPKYMEALDDLNVVPWLGDGFDVLSKGMNKKEGIKTILEILEIPLEQAYAFGDGENDIEMLEFIPHSVAMGNASKNAKAAAKYITTSIDENGIYEGLKMLGFIDD
ncbi:MAG: Cof-type HAD-IIB family hydrolase [Candidatus Izemoplasma sp.]|nr:Cof-type HAD-IIB family hydrolase [Candidatus Izemoplasma sp.]